MYSITPTINLVKITWIWSHTSPFSALISKRIIIKILKRGNKYKSEWGINIDQNGDGDWTV
jgi:hypothetical protein